MTTWHEQDAGNVTRMRVARLTGTVTAVPCPRWGALFGEIVEIQ